MKRLKISNLKLDIVQREHSKFSLISFVIFDFCKQIVAKYAIFRRSINLPTLVYLRLFSTSIINKNVNSSRIEYINSHYRRYFNLYLKTISQLEPMISHYKQSQNYLYPVDYIKTQPEARVLGNDGPYLLQHAQAFPRLYPLPLQGKEGWVNEMAPPSVRSSHPSLSNSFILSVLKWSDGRQDRKEGAIISSGIHSGAFRFGKYLDYLVSKSAEPRGKAFSKTGSEKFVFKSDIAPFHLANESKGVGVPLEQNFYFRNQRKIEQEVEEIKKIVVETKASVTATNHFSPKDWDRAIKQQLDINRISDHVYQNIERRIRIERERRGL